MIRVMLTTGFRRFADTTGYYPASHLVEFNPVQIEPEAWRPALLHEIGHARFRHDRRKQPDVLRMEAEAWRWATAHVKANGVPWSAEERKAIKRFYGTYVTAKKLGTIR